MKEATSIGRHHELKLKLVQQLCFMTNRLNIMAIGIQHKSA